MSDYGGEDYGREDDYASEGDDVEIVSDEYGSEGESDAEKHDV